MSKGNTTENDVIKLVFIGTDPSWRAGSNLYLSLHTADPGEAGDQTTSECAYTSYDRVLVAKGVGQWTVSGNNVVNVADIVFPECTGSSETATHWAVGTADLPSAGQILYKGALDETLAISNNIEPRITAGTLSISED